MKAEYKIIADHLRSTSFLICDGILPSNEGRGYVLRRIMRRAMLQIHKLAIKEIVMYRFVAILVAEMSSHYPELKKRQKLIEQTLYDEEKKFRETLENGLKILNEELQKIGKNKVISGDVAFKLYDTYGFPLDLTQDILKEKNISVNIEEFNKNMLQQKERAKNNWSGSGEEDHKKIFFEIEEKFGSTEFVGYEKSSCKAKILAIETINNNKFVVLDKTPFYATSGGQKGDDGTIILANENSESLNNLSEFKNYLQITETKKFAKSLFVHFIGDFKGSLKVNDQVVACINSINRQTRAQGHSATHLLHKALKNLIDQNITQKGSNIEFDYFTFDFNLNRGLTDKEIFQIEDLVNFYIRQNSKVETKIMPIEKAIKSGAEAVFGDKYEDQVRVLKIGPSLELCGGTHVEYSGNIGIFRIISESGVASGIRRISAKVGSYAFEHLRLQEEKFKALSTVLKINYKDSKFENFNSYQKGYIESEIYNQDSISLSSFDLESKILQEITNIGLEIDKTLKEKDKQISKLKLENQISSLKNIKSEIVANVNFVWHIFKDCDAKSLREITNNYLKNLDKSNIISFFATDEDKVFVCLAITNDLITKFDAGNLIKIAVKNIGGSGGGGQKNFAMGGGNDLKAISKAIEKLKEEIVK